MNQTILVLMGKEMNTERTYKKSGFINQKFVTPKGFELPRHGITSGSRFERGMPRYWY